MNDSVPPAIFFPRSLKYKVSQFTRKCVTLVFTWRYINTHTTDIEGFISSSIMKFYYEEDLILRMGVFKKQLSHKMAIEQNCKRNFGYFLWCRLGSLTYLK